MKNLSTSKTHFQYQAELAGSFGRTPQIAMLNITGNHYTEPDLDSNDPKSKDSLCFLSTDRKKGHELSDRPSFDHRSSANTGVRNSVIEHPHFRMESELGSDISARESATSGKRQRDSLSYKNDMKNVSKLLENITKDLHEAKLDMQLRKFSRHSEEQKDSAVSTVLPSQTEVDSVKLSSPENKRQSSKKSFSSAQDIPSQSEIDNDLISKIDTERLNTEKRMTARNPSPPPEDYLKFNEGRHNRGSKSSVPDLQQIYNLNYLKGNRGNNEYQKNATATNFFTTFRQDTHDKKDYNELTEMLQQEKSRNGKLENQLQDMETLLQQMRVFHDKLYQNYVETKDELQAGKTGFLSTIVQENSQNEKLKTKLDELQKMNHNLIEENKHLKESNKKKTDVIGKLEDQVKATKSEVAILKEKHQAKVESLMSKMKKLEKENLETAHIRENSKTFRKDLRMETEGFSDYMRHDHKGLNETFVDSDRRSRNSEVPESMLMTHRELAKCKEETESVKRENRKLRLELQSLNYSRKSCDLREALQQVENVTQNLIQASENKKIPSSNLMFKTLTDISIEIEVENINAIMPRIKEIQEENRTNKKFVDSFLDLVYKCSPPGNFEKKPTVKQGWKWMKRLMEEYMEMRREGKNDTLRESDLLKKLAAYMGVKNKEDLLSKVKDLINENGLMNKVISKIKTIYHLEWTSPIQELDKKLEMLMNNAGGSGGRMSNKLETRSSGLLTQKLDNK